VNLDVRHAPDAVVGVGGAARWYFRGSRPMLLLHYLVSFSFGRSILKNRYGVRLDMSTWPAENAPDRMRIQPLDPTGAVAALAPTPLLIVHGSKDNYFPADHAHTLIASAQQPSNSRAQLWFEQGMGHAESATTQPLVDRIAQWINTEVANA
jgi:fermentation-respiration switch protein FrsA (DUF1100 family)